MTNGEVADCQCGLDGLYYCQPDWSNEVYDKFWAECQKSDGQLSAERMKEWNHLHKHIIHLETSPPCVGNFTEHQTDWGVKTGIDLNGGSLVRLLSVVAFVLILN
jgi:hypothetical protein